MEIAASPWRVNCPATHRIRRANQVNCFTDHSVRWHPGGFDQAILIGCGLNGRAVQSGAPLQTPHDN